MLYMVELKSTRIASMKLNKLAIVAIPLMLGASAAHASFTTPTQSFSFSGSAGNTSAQASVDPFTFSMFDSNLGDLTGVFISYSATVSGGVLGVDNQTNSEVSGDMELGGGIRFSSPFPLFDAAYQPVFDEVQGSKIANFTLAADPTLSVGGNGPDTLEITGDTYTDGRTDVSVSDILFGNFEQAGGGVFDIDFSTFSINNINAPGAFGYFDSADVDLSMSLYYTYEEPVTTAVSAPFGLALGGLALIGAAGIRRRK